MLNRALSTFLLGLALVGISSVLNAQQNPGENVIRIGPDQGANDNQSRRPVRQQPVAVTQYWIGIEGGEASPALRSHLRLNEEQGLLVNRVMPGSPAEEGKLKVYDIITRVNGKEVRTISEMSDHVGEQGERKGRLAIEIIREGRPNTVWVTPAERPVPELQEFPNRGGFFGGGNFGIFNQHQFQNGVSISIRQANDGTPKISVQRGNERWEIEGDDPEALEQLPEDLREKVQAMLQGNRVAPQWFQNQNGAQINQPIEQLREEILQLRDEMLRGGIQPQPFQPNIQPDPVPQAEPSEIELPAETE